MVIYGYCKRGLQYGLFRGALNVTAASDKEGLQAEYPFPTPTVHEILRSLCQRFTYPKFRICAIAYC